MKFLSKTNLSLGAIIIIGAILRLYELTAISLWHDEAFSALLIRYPLKEMLWRISLDVHPPLYYLILRFWDYFFGDGLFSLRLFSAFFGILTVGFIYLFIKEAFKNEKLALISALFVAVNPFQIQYAVEARMYTLGTFLIVLSSWLLVKAIEMNQKKWWFAYGISAALAIYTHYYLIFSVVAQGLFILYSEFRNYRFRAGEWMKSRTTRGAALAYAIFFIAFLPWLKVFLAQLSQVEQNYWIPKMSASTIPNTLWRMASGSNVDINNIALAIVAAVFLAAFIAFLKREADNYRWLLALSFLVPFLLAIGLSVKRSLYLDRYFVFAGLFYILIFALLFYSIKNKLIQKGLVAIFVLFSLILFVQNWRIISPAGKSGMQGASEYLFRAAGTDDKVYVASSFIYFTYKYYAYRNYLYNSEFNPGELKAEDASGKNRLYPAYLTPLLYTPGTTSLSQIPHFSGTALLNNNDLLGDFSRDAKSRDNVWILWTTGFGGSKPEAPKNWKQMDEAGFQDVFGYRGWIVATKYKVQ